METIKNILIKFILENLNARNLSSLESLKKSSIAHHSSKSDEIEIVIPINDATLRQKLKKEEKRLKRYEFFEVNKKNGFTTTYLFNDYFVKPKFFKFTATDRQLKNLVEILENYK